MESAKQKNRRGFTLAELLVAITVGLIVIAALLSLVVMMNSYLGKADGDVQAFQRALSCKK